MSPITQDLSTTNGLRPATCDLCGKSFKLPSDLNRHVNTIHNPNFVGYPCPFEGCNLVCKQKSNFQTHLRTHTKEQNHFCQLPLLHDSNSICTFQCADPSSMNRHMKRAHALGQDNCPSWMVKKIQERKLARANEKRLASEKRKLEKKAEACIKRKAGKATTTLKKEAKQKLIKCKLEAPSPTGFFEQLSRETLNNDSEIAIPTCKYAFETDLPIAQPQPSHPIPPFSLEPETNSDLFNLASNFGHNGQVESWAESQNNEEFSFNTLLSQQISPLVDDYYRLNGWFGPSDYSISPDLPFGSTPVTQFTEYQTLPSLPEVNMSLYTDFIFGGELFDTSYSTSAQWTGSTDNNVLFPGFHSEPSTGMNESSYNFTFSA